MALGQPARCAGIRALMCLAACAGAPLSPQRQADARRAIEAAATVDVHSHAGGLASPRRIRAGGPFGEVARPMQAGGMAAICLAVVPMARHIGSRPTDASIPIANRTPANCTNMLSWRLAGCMIWRAIRGWR